MPRSARHPLDPGFYHVTARGIRAEPIFVDELDRLGFLQLLADAQDAEHLVCRAYCLMTTHYHLLIETRSGDVAPRMCRLNGLHALHFNRAHGYEGHLFRSRYDAKCIGDEWHLYETVRYLAINPVRAGLCNRAEEWRWSSFAAALGAVPCPPFFDATWTLRLFSEDEAAARDQLRRFVTYEPDYVRF